MATNPRLLGRLGEAESESDASDKGGTNARQSADSRTTRTFARGESREGDADEATKPSQRRPPPWRMHLESRHQRIMPCRSAERHVRAAIRYVAPLRPDQLVAMTRDQTAALHSVIRTTVDSDPSNGGECSPDVKRCGRERPEIARTEDGCLTTRGASLRAASPVVVASVAVRSRIAAEAADDLLSPWVKQGPQRARLGRAAPRPGVRDLRPHR